MMRAHQPVALERCIALLTPSIERNHNPIVVDATLGLGGHSGELLSRFPNLRIVALDRDQEAIKIALSELQNFKDRLTVIHAVYDQMPDVLDSLGITDVDGILFDLGVSSMQLDTEDRGFSYARTAPLDMRMDKSAKLTAREVLYSYAPEDLTRILREYGEERFAKRIVTNIVKARESGRLQTTSDLADIVKESIPAPARRVGGNPAKRTFQAIRIEVNQELAILERAIPRALNRLTIGGRMVVLSFQSLEDKIVKRCFAAVTESQTPRGLPIELDSPRFRLIVRGSESASDEEIVENSRAQSVRLRAIERVAS